MLLRKRYTERMETDEYHILNMFNESLPHAKVSRLLKVLIDVMHEFASRRRLLLTFKQLSPVIARKHRL